MVQYTAADEAGLNHKASNIYTRKKILLELIETREDLYPMPGRSGT